MFLTISETVLLVNEDERKRLAELITAQRKAQFGTKSSAYKSAGVNAATWDRAEGGEPVREDRLQAIVRLLWPPTGGDPDGVLSPTAKNWSDWADPSPSLALGEATGDQIVAWALRHFERINQALAEMNETIESISGKAGMEHGNSSAKKSDDLIGRREDRRETSEVADSLAPAADEAVPGVDEKPGSDTDES